MKRGLLALALLAAGAAAPVQGRVPTEYEVKAAYLYHFTRFVEWPPDVLPPGGQPLVVAVLGEDPFGEVLDRTFAGKTAGGRPLEVRRCQNVEEAKDAQLVFVSASEEPRMQWVLSRLRAGSVLTVGETARFAEQGGIIEFHLRERRVRFDINLGGAERARLRIRSQLLSVATIVAPPG